MADWEGTVRGNALMLGRLDFIISSLLMPLIASAVSGMK